MGAVIEKFTEMRKNTSGHCNTKGFLSTWVELVLSKIINLSCPIDKNSYKMPSEFWGFFSLQYQWCEPKGPKGAAASSPSPDLQWHLC